MTIWRDENQPALRPYEHLWRSGALTDLKHLRRRATELEIAQSLALLLKAFPNAGASDGEIFGATLLEDVVAAEPSVGDVQEACKLIRRTSKFLPTIAEFLEALWQAKQERQVITRSLAPAEPVRPAIAKPHDQIAHMPTTANLPTMVAEDTHLLPL